MNDPPNENEVSLAIFDWDQFFDDSIQGTCYAWLGVTLAGGFFGTFIVPLAGTIVGMMYAGASGVVTCFFGFLLHVFLRGRLPLRVSASFAGATAGIVSVAIVGAGFYNWFGGYFAVLAITAQLGSLGAQIATLRLLKSRGKAHLSLAHRAGQFSTLDVMAFTAWLALVLGSYQAVTRESDSDTVDFLLLAAIVSATMLVTEFLYRIMKDLRS